MPSHPQAVQAFNISLALTAADAGSHSGLLSVGPSGLDFKFRDKNQASERRNMPLLWWSASGGHSAA